MLKALQLIGERDLKEYQAHAIQFLWEVPKGILALDMRMGKSVCALLVANEFDRILIICPVISKIPWVREIEKWLTHAWVDSSSVQTLNTKKDVVDHDYRIHIVPYSLLAHFSQGGQLPKPDYLIVDEMHYCKNFGGGQKKKVQRTHAAMSMVKQVDRVAFLSGTPMPSRPAELWPVLKTLGVFKNKKNYEAEYCAGWWSPWGWDARGASNLDELADRLAPVMFRRTKADLKGEWAEVREPVVIELDLPVDDREKKFDRREIIKNPSPVAFEGMSDILHMNGLRKVPLVVQHVRDVLESEHKVVLFAWHRDVIETLMGELRDFRPVMIHGGITGKARMAAVDMFQTQDSTRLMVANYQAAGESITLDASSYVVFAECSWVPKDIWQPIARCSGHGQKESIRTDILTIHQSIDAYVLHTHVEEKC
jgi:SWI/SNF-related matrix-associated actin-dependent regulator 1 of chromatin subfamily A